MSATAERATATTSRKEGIDITIDKQQVKALVGKNVVLMTRQGQIIQGTLDKFDGGKLYLRSNEPQAGISAFNPFFNPITPLVLFDLLAIAEAPFFFSPFFI